MNFYVAINYIVRFLVSIPVRKVMNRVNGIYGIAKKLPVSIPVRKVMNEVLAMPEEVT